jgi:hypothetical protein
MCAQDRAHYGQSFGRETTVKRPINFVLLETYCDGNYLYSTGYTFCIYRIVALYTRTNNVNTSKDKSRLILLHIITGGLITVH